MKNLDQQNSDAVSATKDARAARRQLSRGEKWALRATLLCGVSLLVALPILLRRNAPPQIVIPPPPPLPNPNAFDLYVKAGTMIVPARAALQPNATSALLQSSIQANAPALRVLRSGFAFPYRTPVTRNFTATFPYLPAFRESSRMFAIESRLRASRGDWSGAIDSRLDGLRFASDLPHGGTLIQALVGIACQFIVRKDAEKIVPHLSAAQARAAAKRMETIYANRTTPTENMQEEKWLGLSELARMFASPGWRSGLKAMSAKALTASTFSWFSVSSQTIRDNFITTMDTHIANARLPYGAPQKPLPQNLDPYSEMVSAVYARSGFNFTRNDTANALLLTVLALRAYQAERGDLPQSLNELAPSYLKSVPLDPFGRGAALKYRRKNASEYSLYSVGPDGRDNGGAPILKNGKSAGRNFWNNARGDIALGVNT